MTRLVLDLEKGRLNTSRLVKKPVTVRGKDGKVHTRMQWVKPGEDPTKERHSSQIEQEVSKTKIPKFYNPYKILHEQKVEKVESSQISLETKERVDNWTKKFKDHPEQLYKILKHLGVTEDDTDPRNIPELSQKDGNGKGPVLHMRNMVKLKPKLMDNPDLMEELDEKFPTTAKAKKPVGRPKSKAEQGGNTIKGILDRMSREEKYDMMYRLGIATMDPMNNPEWWGEDGDSTAPTRHMRNMVALKKKIELDPSLLNTDITGEIDNDEKARLASLEGKEKTQNEVTDFLNRVGRDTKLSWASKFSDHEYMKKRIRSDNQHVDNMHKLSALKKILVDSPELMESDLKGDFDKEQLLNLKITIKEMRKVLFHAVGMKAVGDIVTVEKGVEWEFGDSSFIRIVEDEDSGEVLLSIVDTGLDGEGWDETEFPMSKVKEFLDNLRAGNVGGKVEGKESALHKKLPKDIWKALDEDFDKNYTDDVGKVLKPIIAEAWLKSGRSDTTILLSHPMKVHHKTLGKVLEKAGIPLNHKNIPSRFDAESKTLKDYMYEDLIEKSKSKNANEYIQKWMDYRGKDKVDTYVLHESAKNWTPEERESARKEILKDRTIISIDKSYDGADGLSLEDRTAKINEHIHKSLDFIPFDLLTDTLVMGAVNIHFDTKTGTTSHYNPNDKGVKMSSAYVTDTKINETRPIDHVPANYTEGGNEYRVAAFSDVMSHEFAHAIDNYLSGGNNFTDWKPSKYVNKDNPNPVANSYAKSVQRSNSSGEIGMNKKGHTYAYHKDEWLSIYEGRIYDSRYTSGHLQHNVIGKGSRGELIDKEWNPNKAQGLGLEHWSENVSRYSNAMRLHKEWQEKAPETNKADIATWAKSMYTNFKANGYGDDFMAGKPYRDGARTSPRAAYGYLYHRMSTSHPELHQAMEDMFNRGDFVDQPDISKSEVMDLFINL